MVQEKIVLDKDVFGKSYNDFFACESYDYLFLGSSHCYRSFDPAIFAQYGLSSYNLGSSSQSPLNSYCILKKVIKRTKNVIMEVYPVSSGLSGTESFLSINASTKDISLVADMAFEINDLRCYNMLSIKPIIDNYNRKRIFNYSQSKNGYIVTIDTAKFEKKYVVTLNKENVKKQLEYICKIIELCRDANIALTFIYAPIPRKHIITNEKIFIDELKEIAEKENISFTDMSRKSNCDSKTDYYDDNHLNESGVYKFNHQLIGIIKKGN